MAIKDMSTLDIQIRLLDVIQERENTAFELKDTNNGEEAMLKYRALDKEMNDLIKALANGQVKETVDKVQEQKGENKKVAPEVLVQEHIRKEMKKPKLLIYILSVILLIMSTLNLINSYRYKKVILQEKNFILAEKKILQNLQR